MLLQDNTVVKPASDSGVTALFTADGSPSLFLRKQTALLEADLRNEYLSFQFIQAISGLGLLKELDLQLHYPDGSSQIIKGLATVDEDKLQLLSADTLHQLQQQGYLLVLHAMLLSISQLNKLIQYHNKLPANQTLKSIKLEITRSQH
jgi:predicted NAD/FAD-dependent oxidoreductase